MRRPPAEMAEDLDYLVTRAEFVRRALSGRQTTLRLGE